MRAIYLTAVLFLCLLTVGCGGGSGGGGGVSDYSSGSSQSSLSTTTSTSTATSGGTTTTSATAVTETSHGAATMKKVTACDGFYYHVTIDMTTGSPRRQIGRDFGNCIRDVCPQYTTALATYLGSVKSAVNLSDETISSRIGDIKTGMDSDYVSEIDGLVDSLVADGETVQVQHGPSMKVSDMIWTENLLPDVARTTCCSTMAAWGAASKTGETIVHRNLDMYTGSGDGLAALQQVVELKYSDHKVILMGTLGQLCCVTGINSKTRVFSALIDSTVEKTTYSSSGCRSYAFDLRKAMEDQASAGAVANYMIDSSKKYAVSHAITIADTGSALQVENCMATKNGSNYRRAIRYSDSTLQSGVTWSYSTTIASVNAFLLEGQPDSCTGQKYNSERWKLMTSLLDKKGAPDTKLSMADLRDIMSSYWSQNPGPFALSGDLYNDWTIEMINYIPAENLLQVWFRGQNSWPSKSTVQNQFVTIPIN